MSVRTVRERRRVTRVRATTFSTTICVRSRGKDTKLAKEQARKDQTEQERGIVDEQASGKRDDGGKKGGKKGSKDSKPGYGDIASGPTA